jgi:UDP-N-acetyl-2-amino-2-deoxyglucuronate dehydrogenase
MSMDKIRLAIVGTGGIAGAHLGGYKALLEAGYDQFEIVAVCDVNEERRAAFAAEVTRLFGTTPSHFASAEDLAAGAAAAGIVAADICTPHAFHHTAAVPCLEAGLDVMVEKPCGITVRASDRIIDAAARSGRLVAVAEQVRRGIKARCMDWAINEARMAGDPRFLSVIGFSNWDFAAENYSGAYAWQWRLLKLLTGGGMIFDAGAHYTDMMHFLFGEVDRVYGWLGTFQDVMINSPELGPTRMDVEDTWMATLHFASGLVANWSWSFSAPGEAVAAQVLYCSGGSIRDRGGWMHTFQNGGDITFADGTTKPYEEIEREYRAQLDADTRSRLFPYGVENDVALECWDFVDAVQNRRPPEISAETTKWTKSICMALYESAVAGQPVSVRDVFEGKVSAYQDPVNEYWAI